VTKSDHAPAAIDFVLAQEGGFVDNPADPGGATNRGVSLRAVRNLDADGHAGLDFDLDVDGDVDAADIKLIDEPRARAFYRSRYWNPCRCDDIPWPLSLIVFDAAVNQGVISAVAGLQRTVGTKVDGHVGPNTITAARAAMQTEPDATIRRAVVLRLDRYRGLANAPDFFRGWADRMLQLHVECLKEVA
jgi:lysozyme family protein